MSLEVWLKKCIGGCKSRGEINTQNKAEVLLEKFAKELDTKFDALSEEIAEKHEPIADSGTYVMQDDTAYYGNIITALTIELPSEITTGFRACIDFGCGDVATALVYPDSIVWSGDSLDENTKFVPLHNHRYHIDIWHDSVCIRANASGVVAHE